MSILDKMNFCHLHLYLYRISNSKNILIKRTTIEFQILKIFLLKGQKRVCVFFEYSVICKLNVTLFGLYFKKIYKSDGQWVKIGKTGYGSSDLQNCKLDDFHSQFIRFVNFFENVNRMKWRLIYKKKLM